MQPSLEQLHSDFARTLKGKTAATLADRRRSDPSRWNSRQIVEHLLLTYRSSSSHFDERLHKGRPTQATPSAYQRLQQLFVCRLGYFPDGQPAPAAVIPSIAPDLLDGDSLSTLLGTSLQAMDELLIACADCFGKERFASHHILGPLSADQWRKFHVVHGRHHLKQLRQILAA